MDNKHSVISNVEGNEYIWILYEKSVELKEIVYLIDTNTIWLEIFRVYLNNIYTSFYTYSNSHAKLKFFITSLSLCPSHSSLQITNTTTNTNKSINTISITFSSITNWTSQMIYEFY